MMKNKKNNLQGGFTLIELMVVMGIIAALALLLVGAISAAKKTAVETVHRTNAKAIEVALQTEYAKTKKYCGGTLPCGVNYSFKTAATALGISLSPGYSTIGNCAPDIPASNNTEGGGRFSLSQLSATTFTLYVENSSCDDEIDTITQ